MMNGADAQARADEQQAAAVAVLQATEQLVATIDRAKAANLPVMEATASAVATVAVAGVVMCRAAGVEPRGFDLLAGPHGEPIRLAPEPSGLVTKAAGFTGRPRPPA